MQATRFSLLLLLFFPLYLWAQSPLMQPVGLAEGLPTQTVYDMLEDQHGYLWVGTDQGIFRYNGRRFEPMPLPQARDLNLDNLLLDNQQRIWAKNYANQLFCWSDEGWKEHQLDPKITQKLGSLRQLSLDEAALILLYEKGVLYYQSDTQKLNLLYQAESIDQTFHHIAYENSDSTQPLEWLSVDQFLLLNAKPLPLSNQGPITQTLWIDSTLYWVSRSAQGQAGWYTKQNQEQSIPSSIRNPFYWRQTPDTQRWLCSGSGAWLFGEFPDTTPTPFLPEKRVSDVLVDREGNHWFSTLDEGLWLQPHSGLFTLPNALDGLPSGSYPTRLFSAAKGGMWMGTQNGWIVRVNESGAPVYRFDTGSGSEVEFLHEDLQHQRLLFTQGWLDLSQSPPTFSPLYLSRSLDIDAGGNYLIASGSVASMLHPSLDTLPQLPFALELPSLAFGSRYPALQLYAGRTRRIIHRAADSTYFMATVDGFMMLDKHGSQREIRGTDKQSLIARDIRLDTYDRLWVASQQGELTYIDLKNEVVAVPYPHQNELIERLYPQGDTLWLVSGQHLHALDLQRLEERPIPGLSTLSAYRLYDILILHNRLWVATNQGLVQVDLSQQPPNSPPILHFRGLQVDGQPWQPEQRIPHQNRQISLDFDLIHHASLGENRLWYRFATSESDWMQVPNQQGRLTFDAAAPGSYDLEVRAEANGAFSAPLSLRFRVAYPFWQQPLGLSLIFGCLLGLTVLGVRGYVGRMQRQQAQKEAMLQARLTALRSQMNPHFLFNVLNSVQGYIYGNQKSQASDYLKQFSTLIRGFLSHSDRTSIGLDEEIALLKTYISLESARMEEVKVHWEIDDAIDLSDWKVPPGLIQPFVENAFKHGLLHREGERHLWLRFLVEGPKLRIQIEDNGIGRKAAEAKKRPQSHQSFATQATTERIRLLQELGEFSPSCTITDLFDHNQHPKGTLVDVSIVRNNT